MIVEISKYLLLMHVLVLYHQKTLRSYLSTNMNFLTVWDRSLGDATPCIASFEEAMQGVASPKDLSQTVKKFMLVDR